jgi:hypothetical protein
MAASGPPWLVSSFRFRARLGFSIPSLLSGQRGITPAFGYAAPHPSVGGTLTLMSNALLSTHYRAVRLLGIVHAGRLASAFSRRTAPLLAASQCRGLPVLVHVVSQRARGLRLRRTDHLLAFAQLAVLPSLSVYKVGALN